MRIQWTPVAVGLAAWLACGGVQAASIRLDEKTTVDGDVLQVDDEDVIVRLPREGVKTIDGKPLPKPLIEGVQAPAFQAKDLQGQPQALGAGQVTVLHFWVSWCPHCRSDAPKVQTAYDQFKGNPKVRVVTISLDQKREALEKFVQERHVTYPVISYAEQAAAPGGTDLAELYHITSFPITFLIDQQGVIRQKFRGSFAEAGADLPAAIQKLLPPAAAPAASGG